MPHLLNVWPSVSRRLQNSSRTLLLFDYDGTLTPIVPKPGQAMLSSGVKQSLEKLNSQQRFIVGIVSGRSLEDVCNLVGVTGLIYAGNHGTEVRGPGVDYLHQGAVDIKQHLDQMYGQLDERLAGMPGVVVEHKGLSLTVHYRGAPPELEEPVREAVKKEVGASPQAGSMRVTEGKKVIEVRPNIDWDKGKAIAHILSGFPDVKLPVFFGDDRTDEDGFSVVQDANGMAVFVGPARQPTRAWYRLDSPSEVADTLRLMQEI